MGRFDCAPDKNFCVPKSLNTLSRHSPFPAPGAAPARSRGRVALVAVCTMLIGLTCVRAAAVASVANGNLQLGALLWGGHPDVLHARILEGAIAAAKQGVPLNDGVNRQVELLVSRAPLDAEPFAIKGAVAIRAGDYSRAEMLLL